MIPRGLDRNLTPNRSRFVHWSVVVNARDELKADAWLAAVDAKNRWAEENGHAWEMLEKAEISYKFFLPPRRQVMDDDNVIAGMKWVRDLLQENLLGIIKNDRDLVTAGVEWVRKSAFEGILVTVRERESDVQKVQ
jgi:hypothetical protein